MTTAADKRKEELVCDVIRLQALIVDKEHSIAEILEQQPLPHPFPSLKDIRALKEPALERMRSMLHSELDSVKVQLSKSIAAIKLSARSDPLTGLNNAQFFMRLLDDELTRMYWDLKNKGQERVLCMMFVDLDDFKQFNTLYGHLGGNKALQIMAKTIEMTQRAGDVSGRFGGDEFVVMLPNTARAGGFIAGKHLLVNLNKVGLKISVGVTQYRITPTMLKKPFDGAAEATLLIAKANKAMYQVKKSGKNKVQFFDL